MTFKNPIAALSGVLTFPSIHSPNYEQGVQGWSINRDGTAEFNTLGGSLQINNSGIFFYVPVAGSGTLAMSLANSDGTDEYGNLYKSGLFINQHQLWETSDHSDTILINPNGRLFPTLAFFAAGFNEIANIHANGQLSRLVVEVYDFVNSLFEVNAPFVVTGGQQGFVTSEAQQPPFTTAATFVPFTTAAWSAVSLRCPPSETVKVRIKAGGAITTTTTATLQVGFETLAGSTSLLAPSIPNSVNLCSRGATAFDRQYVDVIIGRNVLSGRFGQMITFLPYWRRSSGTTAADCQFEYASIAVEPSPYVWINGF